MAFLVTSFSKAYRRSSARRLPRVSLGNCVDEDKQSSPLQTALLLLYHMKRSRGDLLEFLLHSVNIMSLDVSLWDFLISLLNNKDKPRPTYRLCSLSCGELTGEMHWSLICSFLPFALGTVCLAHLDPSHVYDPALWMGLQWMCSENAFCACSVQMSRSSAVTSQCKSWVQHVESFFSTEEIHL